jgi:hypothetical protein
VYSPSDGTASQYSASLSRLDRLAGSGCLTPLNGLGAPGLCSCICVLMFSIGHTAIASAHPAIDPAMSATIGLEDLRTPSSPICVSSLLSVLEIRGQFSTRNDGVTAHNSDQNSEKKAGLNSFSERKKILYRKSCSRTESSSSSTELVQLRSPVLTGPGGRDTVVGLRVSSNKEMGRAAGCAGHCSAPCGCVQFASTCDHKVKTQRCCNSLAKLLF